MGLFNISHVVETSLSKRAQGDLRSLFDQIPDSAAVVELLPGGAPDLASARWMPAKDVPVGSNMLVRPGDQVSCLSKAQRSAWWDVCCSCRGAAAWWRSRPGICSVDACKGRACGPGAL